jgi:hypothetical protein
MRTRWIPVMVAMFMVLAASAGSSASVDRNSVRYRDVTLPAGTVIPLVLDSYVASDTSRVESPVRAHVRSPIVINGVTAIPAGSQLAGYVTQAERGGRISGHARVAFRFTRLTTPRSRELDVRTSTVARVARSTKAKDARTIGIPAAGGAVVGALVGGKKGAAIGAAAGAGGGTAVALSTRGPEVRLGRGAVASVRLLSPLTIRVATPAR